MKGTVEDVAASPNDPLFIVHHAMVDCIFIEWLKRHNDAKYPTDPIVRDGHRRDDYVRGFFPLFTNGELFTSAEEFGYSCSLSNLTESTTGQPTTNAAKQDLVIWPLMVLASVLTVIVI